MQATHIFDGLESWPTHLMYLARGELQLFKACADIPELENGRLMRLVEGCVMQPSRLRTWGVGPCCLNAFISIRCIVWALPPTSARMS